MEISSLPLQKSYIDFLNSLGFKVLYPPQQECITQGVLDHKNFLVSTPTASGKTLVAMLTSLNYLYNGGKVVYLAPLRALAHEKFIEFKKLETLSKSNSEKIKVLISTGDFQSNSEYLKYADLLVLTNEKFDSLLRHNVDWLNQIKLFIIDEIHLIGDSYRGSTLEMIIANILNWDRNIQILGLSATVNNIEEISTWLNADYVDSNWRPVPLIEGIYNYGQIDFNNGDISPIKISKSGVPVDLAIDALRHNAQSIIFTETRRRAASIAKSIEKMTSTFLNTNDLSNLNTLSEDLFSKGNNTEFDRTLSRMIKNGVAFHHAGLTSHQREIIETGFRERHIKIISATPTLAAGVNLPAQRVIISSYLRYNIKKGQMIPLSVMEYKQMCGRAGRPQFDSKGETILIASSDNEKDALFDNYINAQPEDLRSSLVEFSSICNHVLGSITSNRGLSKDQLFRLFDKTLYSIQSDTQILSDNVDRSLAYLLEEDLIREGRDKYIPTSFGRQVSRLYINPITGVHFRNSIFNAKRNKNYLIGLLYTVVSSTDFGISFSTRKKDFYRIDNFLSEHNDDFLEPIIIDDYSSNNQFLRSFRSLDLLNCWISEWDDDKILKNLDIQPGDLYRAVENAKWLIHAISNIAELFQKNFLLPQIYELNIRLSYGIKKELIELIRLKQIGRIRARALYNAGYKNLNIINDVTVIRLSQVPQIGKSIAQNIKEQLKDLELN